MHLKKTDRSIFFSYLFWVHSRHCLYSSVLFKALEKAREAGRKERVLVRQREQIASPENLDLTYSVSA